MYAKLKMTNAKGKHLKQYHHINLNKEFKQDAKIWVIFLENAGASILCRPFIDQDMYLTSTELSFFTDASGKIGFGCYFDGKWSFGEWEKKFLDDEKPKH